MRLRRIAHLLGFVLLSASLGYAQDPTFEWVASTGAPATFSGGYGIAHDDLGNVYVTGRFTGTIDFDPGVGVTNLTSAGGQDTYITKVDAGGNLVWARRVGGPNDVYSFDVVVDGSGNVYVTGAFSGTADFDPGPGTFNLSSIGLFFDEIFVLKLDTNGNLAWARKMGGSDFDFGRSIVVSAAGNVITTGTFRGTVDFDPGPGTSVLTSITEGNDIFISKLDAAGNFVWAKQLGGNGNDNGYAVTVDAAENVFTTGSFSATADFDPGASVFNLTEVNNGDIFISKLDGAGNFVWARGMGGTSSDIGLGVQVDDFGNVYTTGYFHTTVDFDPGPGIANLVSAGFNDAFIAKFDGNGDYLWAKGMGGTIDDESSSLALDANGNVYATGSFESTVDFDPGPGTFNLTPGGSGGGFVVKLDDSGDFVWAQAFGGTGSAFPEGIDVGSNGSIYTTGRFSGTVDFDTGPGVSNVTAAGSSDAFIHKMRQTLTPPTIISFAPTTGPVGTTVIIVGTNFSTIPANNIVYFGATRATVTTATSNQLTVTVPVGTTYAFITVLNTTTNLLTSSTSKFTPTFTPNKSTLTTCDFDPRIDLASSNSLSTMVAGDLDGDSKTDLVVSAASALSITTYQNTTTGVGNISFGNKTDLALIAFPQSLALGDLDNDGMLDIAVANHQFANNSISVFRNASTVGTISFPARVTFSPGEDPSGVAIGDLDGDGKADMAVTNQGSNTVSIFRNTSSGPGNISFAAKVDFTTGTSPRSVSIADYDNDGKADLAVVNNGSNSISVFRNSSTGAGNISYTAKVDFTTGTTPVFISTGDFDGDNKYDLAVANFGSNSLSVFRNTSSGTGNINYDTRVDFSVGIFPRSVSVSDINGDGKADIAVANTGTGSVSIFINTASSTGTISFAAKVDLTTPINPISAPIGDLDNDGKVDLATANSGGSGSLSFFRNDPIFTGPPTITSFTPNIGSIGTSVTITGTNFSTTPGNNTVRFNGTTSVVMASTATSITTTVPTGATTGKISVTVACNTATSTNNFTVSGIPVIAINTQPFSSIVCDGITTSFTIAATGTTNIAYQWQFSSTLAGTYTDINNGGGYSNVNTAALSVNTTGNFGAGFYRCRIAGDLASAVFTNAAELTINALPTAPMVINGNSCGSGSMMLTASGGVDGQYRWYTSATGATAISGEANSIFVTPFLTATKSYFVSIVNGCESLRAPVTATINPLPAQPVIASSIMPVGSAFTICSTTSLTLAAPNGFASYNWSNGATTSQITATASGNYSVTVTDASGCTSPASDAITITVVPAPCTNSAPVINTTELSTAIGVAVTIDLIGLISDADGNLEPSSLTILQQPISGALASITGTTLLIDYVGNSFTGTDLLTIQVCDVFGECASQQFQISVIGEIEIFNAVSSNNDGKNEIFKIANIELIEPENTVTIYNRWGSKVFEMENYSEANAFRGLNENGNELPSGTYFYKILFKTSGKTQNGFLVLKR